MSGEETIEPRHSTGYTDAVKKKDLFSQDTMVSGESRELVVTKSARLVLGAAPRLEAHGRSKLLNRKSIGIGRGRQNGVIIADPKVSKFHASITFANKRAYLKDTGSTNGTYLNGKALAYDKPRELHDGDIIVVGNVELTVSRKEAL